MEISDLIISGLTSVGLTNGLVNALKASFPSMKPGITLSLVFTIGILCSILFALSAGVQPSAENLGKLVITGLASSLSAIGLHDLSGLPNKKRE